MLKQNPPAYANGIVFVPLSALRSIEAVPSAIAHQLGFQFHKESPPIQQLCEYLSDKQMLLILDNFEHLIRHPSRTGDQLKAEIEITDHQCEFQERRFSSAEGAKEEMNTGILTRILQYAPGIKLLVTSRIRLNIKEEYIYPLRGIEYPSLDERITPDSVVSPAVQLFVQSASRINPEFKSDSETLADITKICRRVQGLPLGILLAAGWSNLLSTREIAVQLSDENSIDLLESENEDYPDRQRSLRAMLDYSWKLLSVNEQTTLTALSIFRGTFSLEAAQKVTGTGLGDLRSLIDHSLLKRTPGGRYEIHEFTRQFAQQKLADIVSVRASYWHYYGDRLSAWAADIKSERQVEAIEIMDMEIDNIRVAFDLAVTAGNLEFIDKALEGLCSYYDWRYRYPEGLSACRALVRSLEESGSNDHLLARALTWQGIFSPTDSAEVFLRRSLSIFDNPGSSPRVFIRRSGFRQSLSGDCHCTDRQSG